MSTDVPLPSWFDPENPVSPTEAQWATLNEAERRQVCAALPFVVEHDFMSEGDAHARAVLESSQQLEAHFGGGGSGRRPFYIGRSVMVHYPATPGFAPDLFLVFDVPDHDRYAYVVLAEGRPLEFVLEVLDHGRRNKDLERNVKRYAQLQIPEYFVFDLVHRKLYGFRLETGRSTYRPILPQVGRYESRVLGLWLAIEGPKLRFYVGEAPLPTANELRDRLSRALQESIDLRNSDVQLAEQESRRADDEAERADLEAKRAKEAAERAEQEAERAEQEAQRARAALARVAELEAQLRLLQGRSDA